MRLTRALLAASVAAALVLPQAAAQQSGPGRSQPAASSQGAVGTSANRGGAAGVSNPEPGGGPAEAAGPRGGPEATTARRSGYLGGRVTESGGGSTVAGVPATSPTDLSCHDVNPSAMSPIARMSGPNVERLDGARKAVHPARGGVRGRSARYLLASFQEELAKPAPDLELAGTYLGMASGLSVTPEVAMRVSEILCVPLGKEQAANVSMVAEGQRLRLQASEQ